MRILRAIAPGASALVATLAAAACAHPRGPAAVASGAPGTIAAPLGGPSRCGGSGLRFCEDFEAFPVGAPPPPGTWLARGDVIVDDARAARGGKAVRFRSAARGFSMLTTRAPFPIPGNSHFGRAFFYMSPALPKDAAVHWTNVQAYGPVPGRDYSAYVRYGGIFGQWFANYFMTNQKEYGHTAKDELVAGDRWLCLEWELRAGGADELRLWIDGRAIERATVRRETGEGDKRRRWEMPDFVAMDIGYKGDQVDARFPRIDTWMDEVAVDPARIGCDR